jgi:aspartate aminotransferase-like enzyme
MGYISERDVLDALGALEKTLSGLGWPVKEGRAGVVAKTIMDTGGTEK